MNKIDIGLVDKESEAVISTLTHLENNGASFPDAVGYSNIIAAWNYAGEPYGLFLYVKDGPKVALGINEYTQRPILNKSISWNSSTGTATCGGRLYTNCSVAWN